MDADRGPTTKREFMSFEVPAGPALFGHVVDFLGRPMGSKMQLGTDVTVPLFNDSPSMEMRQQINQPLLTGVKVTTGQQDGSLRGVLGTGCGVKSPHDLVNSAHRDVVNGVWCVLAVGGVFM